MKTSPPRQSRRSFVKGNFVPSFSGSREHLSEKELDRLWKTYKQTGDALLRNRIVEHYLHMVKYAAARIYGLLPNSVDQNDLMSAGVFGLMDAVDHFDLSRGVKFETYCACRIRGSILDELRAQDWLPRVARQRAQKLEQVYRDLRSELGRDPTQEEVAEQLGVPLRDLNKIVMEANAAAMMSLDRERVPNGNGDGDEYSEMSLISNEKAAEPSTRMQRQDVMGVVTKGLSEQERLILVLYYYEKLTMKEIGHVMGVTESRVSQIHGRILLRLRNILKRRRGELLT